ncbi:hypothetical protein FHX57_002285 [Paraburkholderia tropica]|nr:hypothetical protein [Paraburkholderia tropica]MBB6319574.1 hypothetical protein [Paraburkholderia tropica]
MGNSYSFKDVNPLWSLTDPLSIEDAAALIAGFDPHSGIERRASRIAMALPGYSPHKRHLKMQ